MLSLITINQLIHGTSLLWLLITAVWLGSLPFVKRTIHKQSLSSRFEQAAVLATGIYLLFGSPSNPDWFNQPALTVTLPIALAGFALAVCGIGFSIWARLTVNSVSGAWRQFAVSSGRR